MKLQYIFDWDFRYSISLQSCHFANLIIQDIFLKEPALNFYKKNSAYHKSHHHNIHYKKEDLFQNFFRYKKI